MQSSVDSVFSLIAFLLFAICNPTLTSQSFKLSEVHPHVFMQTRRGYFDVYDRAGEKLLDETVIGYCSSFSPPYENALHLSWLAPPGWEYSDLSTISYSGKGESYQDPPFLLFWKKKRFWTMNSLLKLNYLCKSTSLGAEVHRVGPEAGLLFRVRGTWDFWALLLNSNGVELVRVVKGERKQLITVKFFPKEWTWISVSDRLGDVEIEYGTMKDREKREWHMKDFEEVLDEHQGGAGLISVGGGAQFRNVVLGDVSWEPSVDPIPKFSHEMSASVSLPLRKNRMKEESENLWNVQTALNLWCPDPALCCPNCGTVKMAPTTNMIQ